MKSPLSAFARYRSLTDEQRVLVGGRGADTRPLAAWRSLLEGLAGFEAERVSSLRACGAALVVLAVATGALLILALWSPMAAELGRPLLWGSVAGAVLTALALDGVITLRRRRVERQVTQTLVPFLQAIEQELGAEASTYLALRFDGARPTREEDVRWLEGAVALADGTLLHFSARDVAEPSGERTWLRATWSRPAGGIEEHFLGEDDPTVSGLTRTVAEEARREGNPFNSMEMIALREAHGVQRDLLRLEAFEEQRVPPPPVGDVLGEVSRGIMGGRSHDDVKADVLLELAKAARQGAA